MLGQIVHVYDTLHYKKQEKGAKEVAKLIQVADK